MVVDESKEYIDLRYSPDRDDVVCEYLVFPIRGVSFETVAKKIASESGIGSWTTLSTLEETLFGHFSPKVFRMNKSRHTIKVAYPSGLFESNNIPQLLSVVAGNIFAMQEIKSLKLLDIEFPRSFVRNYFGPHYGISGVRYLMRVQHRPLLGAVVKPKVGLDVSSYSKIAFESWAGGCDFVSDDENLTSLPTNNFNLRVKEVLKMRALAEKATGERKAYLPNITAPYREMIKRAKSVVAQGNEFVLVDVCSIGFSALQDLRALDLRVVLHGHRTGHGVFTKSPEHGMSMLVLAKLCRLIGVDQLQVGGIGGKEGPETISLGEEIEQKIITQKTFKHRLQEDWLNLKPIFAICSGAIHPRSVRPLIHSMGRDIIIQAGGGIHGHPLGSFAGAKAMRDAIDAEMFGALPSEYAKKSKELSIALKTWK